MNFWVYNHLGKGTAYVKALQKARHQQVRRIEHADLVLLDSEHPARTAELSMAERRGLPVCVFPHGGNPSVLDNGPTGYWPSTHVATQFIPAPGHYACWKAQGGPARKFVLTGFPWCEQQPFRPTAKVETVVFAPVHPSSTGDMDRFWHEANRRAQERIRELFPAARVLVSVWFSLAQNGLDEIDGWTYLPTRLALSTDLIDQADLVVANETFACLAVARGVPTVMIDQTLADWGGRRWQGADAMDPLWWYPHAIEGDVLKALENEAGEWRRQFIGGPFQPQTVVKACERAVKEGLPLNAGFSSARRLA